MARKTFGNLKPEHILLLNPHAETKLSRCPRCEKLTYPRKFAFLIHVERWGLYIHTGDHLQVLLTMQDDHGAAG